MPQKLMSSMAVQSVFGYIGPSRPLRTGSCCAGCFPAELLGAMGARTVGKNAALWKTD